MFIPMFFWLPAIASVVTFVTLWYAGELSRAAAGFFSIWSGSALFAQLQSPQFSWAWVVGLVGQTVLAIVLTMKWMMAR